MNASSCSICRAKTWVEGIIDRSCVSAAIAVVIDSFLFV